MENQSVEIRNMHVPRWSELPDIDLYMDQVLSYINGKLEPLKMEDKPILTSSMVNNYVKSSIVQRPEKKHYRKYHVAFLFVVVLMKWCFSLGEISDLIAIYSDLQDPDRLSHDYDKFVSSFESCLKEIFDTGNIEQKFFEDATDRQQLMTNVIRAVTAKIYVQSRIRSMKPQQKQ